MKVFIIFLFFKFQVVSQVLFDSIELVKYETIGKMELSYRYRLSDFVFDHKILSKYFSLDSLNIISIPIYNKENTIKLLKNKPVRSNPNYQKVLVYFKNTLVTDFIIDNFLLSDNRDLNKEPLLYYAFIKYDFPIYVGSKIPVYFKKDIYISNKDIFLCHNLEGLFIFKNNSWHYLTKKYPEFIEDNINVIENFKVETYEINKNFIRSIKKM